MLVLLGVAVFNPVQRSDAKIYSIYQEQATRTSHELLFEP